MFGNSLQSTRCRSSGTGGVLLIVSLTAAYVYMVRLSGRGRSEGTPV